MWHGSVLVPKRLTPSSLVHHSQVQFQGFRESNDESESQDVLGSVLTVALPSPPSASFSTSFVLCAVACVWLVLDVVRTASVANTHHDGQAHFEFMEGGSLIDVMRSQGCLTGE